jgi:hypothetical protein
MMLRRFFSPFSSSPSVSRIRLIPPVLPSNKPSPLPTFTLEPFSTIVLFFDFSPLDYNRSYRLRAETPALSTTSIFDITFSRPSPDYPPVTLVNKAPASQAPSLILCAFPPNPFERRLFLQQTHGIEHGITVYSVDAGNLSWPHPQAIIL